MDQNAYNKENHHNTVMLFFCFAERLKQTMYDPPEHLRNIGSLQQFKNNNPNPYMYQQKTKRTRNGKPLKYTFALICFLLVITSLALVLSGQISLSSFKQRLLGDSSSNILNSSNAPLKVIVVDESKQWLSAYEDGKLVFDTPVTTGRPELETPTGTFKIRSKLSPKVFVSPWPIDSPYYYTSFTAHYAMYFLEGGFYLHDTPDRKMYGPGSNVPHTLPDGTEETGSHGCINVPLDALTQLYEWAPVGTELQIKG
jgi:lipoprotein-anchoring transpeptidase ErfK/SrfK